MTGYFALKDLLIINTTSTFNLGVLAANSLYYSLKQKLKIILLWIYKEENNYVK